MGDQDRRKSRVSMIPQGKSVGMLAGKSMGTLSGKSIAKLPGMKSMSRMRMRRMSYGFRSVGGIGAVDTTTHGGIEFKRPPLLYLSTYQLDPHPGEEFNVRRVMKMINSKLDDLWNGHKYNASETPALALRLAGEMMRKVKLMAFNRYRVICVVTIGQKRAQSYNNAITFIWDHERDNYADVQRECTTNFIHVTIFGVYLD